MPIANLLFDLLTQGAALVASGATAEFAKGVGKTAFEALKARLTDNHEAKSLALLEDAAANEAYATAVKEDLGRPDILADEELLKLAEDLRQAIAAVPAETKAHYAIDAEKIQSGAKLIFDTVEGIKAKTISSKDNMEFKNIKAPQGN